MEGASDSRVSFKHKLPLLNRVVQLVHEIQCERRSSDVLELNKITHRLRHQRLTRKHFIINVITKPLEAGCQMNSLSCDNHCADSDAVPWDFMRRIRHHGCWCKTGGARLEYCQAFHFFLVRDFHQLLIVGVAGRCQNLQALIYKKN